MQQVDGLERAHHHLEMRDAAIVSEGNDVDAIDPDAIDLVFELKHRAGVAAPFPDIGKAWAAQHLVRAQQILEGDLAPALRRMHDRTFDTASGSSRSHSAARSWDLV